MPVRIHRWPGGHKITPGIVSDVMDHPTDTDKRIVRADYVIKKQTRYGTETISFQKQLFVWDPTSDKPLRPYNSTSTMRLEPDQARMAAFIAETSEQATPPQVEKVVSPVPRVECPFEKGKTASLHTQDLSKQTLDSRGNGSALLPRGTVDIVDTFTGRNGRSYVRARKATKNNGINSETFFLFQYNADSQRWEQPSGDYTYWITN